MPELSLADIIRTAFTLLEQAQVNEARTLLKRALKTYPRHLDLMFLLAQAERRLENFAAAITLLKQCCALSPLPVFHEQLGKALMQTKEGRNMGEAAQHFAAALAAQPGLLDAATNLLVIASRRNMPAAMVEPTRASLALPIDDARRLTLCASHAIAAYLHDELERALDYNAQAQAVSSAAYDGAGQPVQGNLFYLVIYTRYIEALIHYRHRHPECYQAAGIAAPALHVIGESHSLAASALTLTLDAGSRRVKTHWQMGSKAYHFTTPKEEDRQFAVIEMLRAIPADDAVVIMFGELDCRPDEGIIPRALRDPAYDLDREMATLVQRYVQFMVRQQRKRRGSMHFFGVPAPNPMMRPTLTAESAALLPEVIRRFNAVLAAEALAQGQGFVAIHPRTVGPDGWAIPGVHIDNVHLMPGIVAEALQTIP